MGRRPIELGPRGVGRAMCLAPLVGLVVWLPAALLMYGTRVVTDEENTPLAPLLALTTMALLTGFMHLDGLADLADGLGSRRSGEAALAVMRDSSVGAVGAAVVAFAILIEFAALSSAVSNHHGTVTLLTSQLAGRLAIVLACRPGIPAARSDGLGVRVTGSVSNLAAAATTLVVLAIVGVAGKLDYDGGRFKESAHAIFAVLCALLVAEIVRRIAVWRLGGITGDVYGALFEVAVIIDLAIMSASVPGWLH